MHSISIKMMQKKNIKIKKIKETINKQLPLQVWVQVFTAKGILTICSTKKIKQKNK